MYGWAVRDGQRCAWCFGGCMIRYRDLYLKSVLTKLVSFLAFAHALRVRPGLWTRIKI